jgi:hypothetical protein
MSTITYDTLSHPRGRWQSNSFVAFAAVICAAVALLSCGVVFGLALHQGDAERTQSLTPAATSPTP